MKNDVIKIAVYVLFCCLLSGCLRADNISTNAATDRFGNTNGNLQEGGYVVVSDGWMYYTNTSIVGSEYTHHNLYKRKLDGSCETKLVGARACYMINVIEDWIYYVEGSHITNHPVSGYPCRISVDGKKSKLLNTQSVSGLIATNQYLFFRIWSSFGVLQRTGDLYRMDLNGNNKLLLTEGVFEFSIDSNWIYYSNIMDDRCLYKVDYNGENITKLNTDYSSYINIAGDYIYYTNPNEGDKLFRIKNDGTHREIISENQCMNVNLYGGYIYYRNESQNGGLYRIRLDGSENTELVDGDISRINVTDYFIMYWHIIDGIGYYKMVDLDGGNERDWEW